MGLALLANWVFVEWTYTDFGPQAVLPVNPLILWGAADCAFGVAALWFGLRTWWGWALWSVTVLQCGFHQLYQWHGVSTGVYLWWLDKLLLAAVTVFILGGGKGVADRVHRFADRRWNVGRAYIAARRRAP